MARIGVIVLAAGRSARFGPPGSHKLLATVGDVPLVRVSVRGALEADVGEVIVVTGAQSVAVEAALAGMPIRLVREPRFADGMAASLRRGVATFKGSVGAVMIGLGDQPGVRPDAYRRVVAEWDASGAAIVVPRYADAGGPAHPALFAAAVFDELLGLVGDVGARSVIARDPSRVSIARIDWPAPRDVDTLDDLKLLTGDASSARAEADRGPSALPLPATDTSK